MTEIELTELPDYRAKIDALDDEIIDLIQRRKKLSKKIQKAKVDAGLSRVDILRERQVIEHYLDKLSWEGGGFASMILRISKES